MIIFDYIVYADSYNIQALLDANKDSNEKERHIK